MMGRHPPNPRRPDRTVHARPTATHDAEAESEFPAAPQIATVSILDEDARDHRRRNTALFSALTLVSRVAGLLREVVAKALYGTSGPASAFVLAFQIPNLLRSLFADAALSSAFVPVFSDLLQRGSRKAAFRLAAELSWLILISLSLVVGALILVCPVLVPLFTHGDQLSAQDTTLAIGLTQVMFPVVALLGLNGLLVGILNAEDHFAASALSPVIWNLVIVAFMVTTYLLIDGPGQLYGYAAGVVVGTVAQLAVAIPLVRRSGYKLGRPRFAAIRNPDARKVLVLMLPVAIGFGLVNFNLLINTTLGFRVAAAAPTAIDAAFRLVMLPQGVFSVAIATVLFPALSRAAARNDDAELRALVSGGTQQVLLLLIPATAVVVVLADPMTHLVYQRGAFDSDSVAMTSAALWVFALALPFNGVSLVLTRTFFAIKDPWVTTRLAAMSLVVNVVVSALLFTPFGVAGVVAGTVVASACVMTAQLFVLRSRLDGRLGMRAACRTGSLVLLATAGLTVAVVGVSDVGIRLAGTSHVAMLFALVVAVAIGAGVYLALLWVFRVEAVRRALA